MPPKSTLPRSLAQALPTAVKMAKLIEQMNGMIPALTAELENNRDAGAVEMARAFVVLHQLDRKLNDSKGPSFNPMFSAVFQRFKTEVVPEVFETGGVPHVPLSEGYRVGVSHRLYASIIGDKKPDAYKWLRSNKLGDLITETVNASTLSAAARHMLEEQNKELPDTLFNVAMKPNTSVTAT